MFSEQILCPIKNRLLGNTYLKQQQQKRFSILKSSAVCEGGLALGLTSKPWSLFLWVLWSYWANINSFRRSLAALFVASSITKWKIQAFWYSKTEIEHSKPCICHWLIFAQTVHGRAWHVVKLPVKDPWICEQRSLSLCFFGRLAVACCSPLAFCSHAWVLVNFVF